MQGRVKNWNSVYEAELIEAERQAEEADDDR